MTALPKRKYCPVDVRCRVALRQLGELHSDLAIEQHRRMGALSDLLDMLKQRLAAKFGCMIADLRRDHNPALGDRELNRRTGRYTPDENDPEYMEYRPHGAEFQGSHDVKTRVRGDHGQYSDIQLIKRRRRREDKKTKPKKKWPKGRKLQSRNNLRSRAGND